jgi:glucose/arabinose dehydrogenase
VLAAEAGRGRVVAIQANGEVSVIREGLARPTGLAIAEDGPCLATEAGRGRVVSLKTGEVLVDGLDEPHGIVVSSHDVPVLDVAHQEAIVLVRATGKSETVARRLPVGAPPGVVSAPLATIPDMEPGPAYPFADLASGPDGTIFIASEGNGIIFTLSRSAPDSGYACAR